MPELKQELYWSKFAQGYDEGVNYIVGKSIQQEIKKKLSEEHDLGDVVEFGCGTGYFTKIIAKNANHVIATDLSDEMLKIARIQLKKYKNITVKKADCENASLPSGRFDTVFLANVIHFIENPNKALLESHRILNDNGLLLLVDYTSYGMKPIDKMKLGIRFMSKCGIPPRHFQTNLSQTKFSSLVETAGFKIEVIHLLGDKTRSLYLKGRKKQRT